MILPCKHCGARVEEPPLGPGEALRCGRCKTLIRKNLPPSSFQASCAIASSALFFLLLANLFPVMTFSVAGNQQSNEIFTGVFVLSEQGYWPVSILITFCAVLAPGLYFGAITWISAACFSGCRLPLSLSLLAVAKKLRPWSLVPVFAVACIAAAFRLKLMGEVLWQPGIVWIFLVALCSLLLSSVFDFTTAERLLLKANTRRP